MALNGMALSNLALSGMALSGLAHGGGLRLVILDRELDRPSPEEAFDLLAQLLRALLLGGFVVVLLVAPDDRADEREVRQCLHRARRDGAHGLADPRRQIVQSIDQPLGQLAQAGANGGAAQDARALG